MKSEHLGSPGATDERPDQIHTVVFGALTVVKGLKPTNQIVNFERTSHSIGL
jgi:hypothetical protein